MFHFIAVVVAFSLLAGSSSATVTCAPQSSTYSATPALLDAAESAKNGACTSSTFCTFDEHGICTHAQTFSDYWAVGVIDCTETQFQLACSTDLEAVIDSCAQKGLPGGIQTEGASCQFNLIYMQ